MIDPEQLWTGELNRRTIGGRPPPPTRVGRLVRAKETSPGLLAAVKELGACKHGLVTNEEFRELVDER